MLQLGFLNFKANSYLFVEDTDAVDKFFIIRTGKVHCYHEIPVPGDVSKTLGPGDFVGVIPCMTGHRHTETVQAVTDVSVIVVRKDQYPDLIVSNAPIAMKIIRYFAREMRIMNDTRTKVTLKKESMASSEELYSIARCYEEMGALNAALYAYYQYLKLAPNGDNADAAKSAMIGLKGKAKPLYLDGSTELVRTYPFDSMIFADCQPGPDMFIIQEGTVKITKVVDGQEVILAMLKKGDMFGEMALLDNTMRSASAVAHSDCKVMVVNANNFNVMVASQPEFVARLSSVLAERVWSMYRQLVNAQFTDSRERMIDMLALQVEIMGASSKDKGLSIQTEFTPRDLINLSGIEESQQKSASYMLFSDPNVKVKQGKIFVPDVLELIKQAEFYRKQMARRNKGMQNR